MITLFAYAKINLTLEVLGRRDDGYHEVRTVLQAVDLKDTLTFEHKPGIDIECDRPELETAHNVAVQAARLLGETTGYTKGALISIKKGIPVSAGLGGGASDAAVTLRALNELWQLGLSYAQLLQLAAEVGSDVPFFVHGGTASGEGRGEKLTSLPPFPPSPVVLVKPPVDLPCSKTGRLYASLAPSHFSAGQFSERMVQLLQQGGDIPFSSFFNTFESVAFSAFPGLEECWQHLLDLGADNVHLAGSGPALFTLVNDEAEAKGLYQTLSKEGLEAYLVETVAGC